MKKQELIDKYKKQREVIADKLSDGVEHEADRMLLIGKANTLVEVIKDLEKLEKEML